MRKMDRNKSTKSKMALEHATDCRVNDHCLYGGKWTMKKKQDSGLLEFRSVINTRKHGVHFLSDSHDDTTACVNQQHRERLAPQRLARTDTS